MVLTVLMMMVGGIGLAQASSQPHQVTPGWLRLGGLIALSLLAVAMTIGVSGPAAHGSANLWLLLALTTASFTVQLLSVQLDGGGNVQRVGAAVGFGTSVTLVTLLLEPVRAASLPGSPWFSLSLTATISCGLLGGSLMTMLLGHQYLSAARLSQRPFKRLIVLLAALVALRALASVGLGLVPYLRQLESTTLSPWSAAMVVARYAVGLLVPGIFLWMVYDCAKRLANQSATGILYVTLVLLIVGEGAALGLIKSTGRLF